MTYFLPVDAPIPVTPVKSMERTTVGWAPKSGSVTTFAFTWACPEKLTFSGAPITAPLTMTRAEVEVVVVVEEVEVEVVVLAEMVVCALTSGGNPTRPARITVVNKDR